MQAQRRKLLKLFSLMVAGGLLPVSLARAEEWNKAAFEAKKVDDVVRMLGGSAPQQSTDLVLNGPEIAENGAVVPLEVESRLTNTESIAILIEKNPNVLAAYFSIPAGTLPWLQTRVKMAETCNVYALARADGRFYYAAREIKVTIGGCGG